MVVSGQLHTPTTLPRGKDPRGTHWIGDWVGLRAGVGSVAKIQIPSLCRESNSGCPARNLVTILTELPRLRFGLM